MEVIGLERVDQKAIERQVGRLIKRERGRAEISQEELAERMRPSWPKISKGYISNLETGRRTLRVSQLFIVATALGIEVSLLLPENPSAEKESPEK